MNDIAIDKEHLHYLEQLSEMYPTIGKASSEIINLQAILNLPKGTEHFVSDVHGEYEAFSHVLKNGSGAVRKKIDDVFGLAMDKADKAALATLIYYPREKMELKVPLPQSPSGKVYRWCPSVDCTPRLFLLGDTQIPENLEGCFRGRIGTRQKISHRKASPRHQNKLHSRKRITKFSRCFFWNECLLISFCIR